MNRPKFSKIYFPGLISLVFLPLLCICYLISNNSFQEYRAMDIMWLPKKELNAHDSQYGRKFDVETFRKYSLINITGNEKADALAFSRLRSSFNQLAAKNDTTNGIKLSFGIHATYGELVSALDFCLQDDEDQGLFFAPTESGIFIGRNGIAKSLIAPPGNLDNDVVYYKPKQPFISFEKINSGLIYLYKILKEYWPSVLAFILMLSFIILKKRRFLDLKTFHLVGH